MESMNYWLGELSNRAAGTQEKYKIYFLKFCDFAKMTPDQLIEKRRKDLKEDDPRAQRAIECLLKQFINSLRETGMSPATQQIAIAAVKSFFEGNEYPLRTKRSDYPKGESNGVRAITKQAIKQMLEDRKGMKDKRKVRALILLLKDTGLRVSDVRNLNYGHVADGLERNLKFIPLTIKTQKSATVAKTFLGPESIEALKNYLDERRKGSRRIPAETITRNSPLFRLNRAGNVQRVSRGDLSGIARHHALKTGTDKLSAHSFRKFLQTSLDAAGVSPNWIDRMLGHVLAGTRDPYSQPSDEQLLKAYVDAYPLIRVFPDATAVEERISKLEEQLAERNRTIANLTSNGETKTSELESLKKQIETLNSQFSQILRMKRMPAPTEETREEAKKAAEKLKKEGLVLDS